VRLGQHRVIVRARPHDEPARIVGVVGSLATLLRLGSRLACLIVVVSFVIFVVERTSSASSHQQNAITGTASGVAAPTVASKPAHEGAVHRVIDEVAGDLTSPFSGITAGSTSQWAIRGVGTLMALLVYGIGVGFLARILRLGG
jgi:hypothetical protein